MSKNITDAKDKEIIGIQGRRFNFFMIGNDIADTEDLNIYEKAVCYQIARYSNNGGIAFPSYTTLARKCGMSRDKAIKTVKALIEKNYLIKIIRKDDKENHQSNIYILNDNIHKFSKDNSSSEIPGGSPQLPGVVVENDSINNNNINNIYGGVKTPAEQSEVNKKNADESNQHKRKKSKKEKMVIVDEDSVYSRIIKHFNSKDNTEYKASTKEYVENIDALLTVYTEEEIIGVIDYIKECNYKKKYFRPSTIFRPCNFEKSYEFYQNWDGKKAHTNNVQAPSQKQLFYIVKLDLNKVITSPIRPSYVDDSLIFTDEKLAIETLERLSK